MTTPRIPVQSGAGAGGPPGRPRRVPGAAQARRRAARHDAADGRQARAGQHRQVLQARPNLMIFHSLCFQSCMVQGINLFPVVVPRRFLSTNFTMRPSFDTRRVSTRHGTMVAPARSLVTLALMLGYLPSGCCEVEARSSQDLEQGSQRIRSMRVLPLSPHPNAV